jgi:hypothetical protein
MRQHWEVVQRQTGKIRPELSTVVVPDGFMDLFVTYFRLYSGDKLKYGEIAAYMDTTGNRLLPWEVNALVAMDNEYQSYAAERIKKGATGA